MAEAQSDPQPRPGNVGGLIDQLMAGRLPSAGQQTAWIEQVVCWIKDQVADAQLRDTPCLRAAEAVVHGHYPARELVAVIFSLNKADQRGTLRHARWMYFVTAVRRSMAKHDSRNL